jgi:cytochrome P450
VNEYAAPLAAEVIASLLGVTIRHPGRFVEWMSNTATVLSGDKRSPRGTAAALRNVHTHLTTLDSLIFEGAPEPANTLLRSLADESREPGGLSRADITSNVAFLLFAGYETTASLIGNAIFMLLRDRRRFGGADMHASIQPATIEELLRYESPVQIAVRAANADTQIDGQHIRAGDRVLVLLGSANRDPSRFPRPHILDPSRPHNSHLAFSHGPHYCLGAGLARSEGKIAVGALFRRFPHVRLVSEEADWRDIPEFRGLRRLPVWLR